MSVDGKFITWTIDPDMLSDEQQSVMMQLCNAAESVVSSFIKRTPDDRRYEVSLGTQEFGDATVFGNAGNSVDEHGAAIATKGRININRSIISLDPVFESTTYYLNGIATPVGQTVLIHELLHLLGIVSVLESFDENAQIHRESGDYLYTGANAVEKYKSFLAMADYPAGYVDRVTGILLENNIGPGSDMFHIESGYMLVDVTLVDELRLHNNLVYPTVYGSILGGMTFQHTVMTELTGSFLQDMGYEINYDSTEFYEVGRSNVSYLLHNYHDVKAFTDFVEDTGVEASHQAEHQADIAAEAERLQDEAALQELQRMELAAAEELRQAEEEAARVAAEQEAARVAAEQEAIRDAAEQEATRVAAEQEAARVAVEQEVARVAAEQEAARVAVEQEVARVAAEQEAARAAALPQTTHHQEVDEADDVVDAVLDDAEQGDTLGQTVDAALDGGQQRPAVTMSQHFDAYRASVSGQAEAAPSVTGCGTKNNGVSHAATMGMPAKFGVSADGALFSQGRRSFIQGVYKNYNRSLVERARSGPVNKTGIVLNNNSSGDVVRMRKIRAMGSSTRAGNNGLAFKNFNKNTSHDAARRCRAGGAVAPPKKGANSGFKSGCRWC